MKQSFTLYLDIEKKEKSCYDGYPLFKETTIKESVRRIRRFVNENNNKDLFILSITRRIGSDHVYSEHVYFGIDWFENPKEKLVAHYIAQPTQNIEFLYNLYENDLYVDPENNNLIKELKSFFKLAFLDSIFKVSI